MYPFLTRCTKPGQKGFQERAILDIMEGNRDANHEFELPAGLLTSNTPLPYESRAALKTKLEHLESGFAKLAGQPYSDNIPLICLPPSVHPLFTSMVAERSVLRSVRHLPDEVLQQVFLFSCFDSEGKHNDQALRRLCSVDRRWREAAINRCLLWSLDEPPTTSPRWKGTRRCSPSHYRPRTLSHSLRHSSHNF